MHPDKSRLIEFGSWAAQRRRRRGDPKPESFDFLGFTHSCSTTRDGRFSVRRKSIAKRMRAKLASLLELLPQAVRQAHERIIGERVVPNNEKILSLYQPHAQVYVRGKAGADTEFGLQMLLCESAEGLILDCTFTDDRVAADNALLLPAIERMRGLY